MKIDCEVVGVKTDGDELEISAQGTVRNAADWRPCGYIRIDVPDVPTHQKAFYVGRKFSLIVSLKP